MEPKAETPARDGNWYDRLPPTSRAIVLAVITLLVNAALAWVYTHLAPGTPAPQLPTPQVQNGGYPPIIVLNMGTPNTGLVPVSVSKP